MGKVICGVFQKLLESSIKSNRRGLERRISGLSICKQRSYDLFATALSAPLDLSSSASQQQLFHSSIHPFAIESRAQIAIRSKPPSRP